MRCKEIIVMDHLEALGKLSHKKLFYVTKNNTALEKFIHVYNVKQIKNCNDISDMIDLEVFNHKLSKVLLREFKICS